MSTPKVSIGMPVYNGARFLQEALDSLLAQTFTDFELIISDNASTDETETICHKYAKQDARICYIQQSKNIGAAANFQFVLEQARGEYFMWFACDDLCDPEFIVELIAFLEKHSLLVGCMSDVTILDEQHHTIRIENLQGLSLENNWEQIRYSLFTIPPRNSYFTIYGLYKTQVIKQVGIDWIGGWKGLLLDCERCFLAKVATFGRIAAIPKTLKYYRCHNSSLSSRQLNNIGKLDLVLLRVSIRIKLLKIVLFSELLFRDRMTLLWGVTTSYIKLRFMRFIKNKVKYSN
ncbi:glycosyltransferase family 2 protein [Laspinema olomoucense]|uniref:glycosyltransferase family 2 protein n=1 Tax=Laspinema olomoucense TaxID=3231600 RepID=UPI0021BA4BEB|nr:glycosyltransferase family 2 protein [Laspinema sp. D3a]MCT7990061.1 glycosyltransferase family 2 protein [Laspinema sp. D3a]